MFLEFLLQCLIIHNTDCLKSTENRLFISGNRKTLMYSLLPSIVCLGYCTKIRKHRSLYFSKALCWRLYSQILWKQNYRGLRPWAHVENLLCSYQHICLNTTSLQILKDIAKNIPLIWESQQRNKTSVPSKTNQEQLDTRFYSLKGETLALDRNPVGFMVNSL